jgi:hypothetical protein
MLQVMKRRFVLAWLATSIALAAMHGPVRAEDAQFPLGSRLGLKPPPGLTLSTTFPGFEDRTNNVFIRLIALPDKAFAEIEKTMTNDALKKQGITVEKRESLLLKNGKSLLIIARQEAEGIRFRKWLLVAPLPEVTALVSFEIPQAAKDIYSDAAIRAALTSLTARTSVPVEEQLSLVPFRLGDLAGLRVVAVIPGRAIQLTDGPKNAVDTIDQPHMVIGAVPGGPQQAADRDNFARFALAGLPPLKDMRIISSEAMRIGGQQGHEIRAEGKDAKSGIDVEIVQWLRFGTGAYLRLLGFAPKENWTQTYARFRAVRDGLEPR